MVSYASVDEQSLLLIMKMHANESCLMRRVYSLKSIILEEKIIFFKDYTANFVILSSIYTSTGRWDDIGRVKQLMVVKKVVERFRM